MIFKTYGNFIYISYTENELTESEQHIILPDGYSYEDILIIRYENVSAVQHSLLPNINIHMIFPPIKSTSPCTLTLFIPDRTKKAELRLLICKFGQIPNTHYFDKAFDPILVVGDDGKEYNVIPSDQFK